MKYLVIYEMILSFSIPVDRVNAVKTYGNKKEAIAAMTNPPAGYSMVGARLFEAKEIKVKPVFREVKSTSSVLERYEEE